MKIILILVFIFSFNSFACRNFIPESEARKAVALEPDAGSKTCQDLPQEKCLCFDGVDWRDTDLVDGQLVLNPDKKFARELAEKSAKESEEKAALDAKSAEELIQNFDFKATTIAGLKTELKALVDALKKRKR
jgi:hypothetical protein